MNNTDDNRIYTTDVFFDWLYEKQMAQNLEHPFAVPKRSDDAIAANSTKAFGGSIAEKKARLRTVLGLDTLQAMACPPEWRVLCTRELAGYREEQAIIQTLPGLYTPVYVLTPSDYRRTFIYCHGHGKGAEEVVDPRYAADYQKCLPITLAQAGYRVIVPELIGFNRVVAKDFREASYSGCYAIATRLLMYGMTMTAARVNQILQLVARVNREGAAEQPVIGGISGGGLVTAYTAALCDTIAGAFISGYANTFKGSIMALFHCVDNFVPNILSVGEEPEIMAMACPTPLLFSNGDEDDIFPVTHARAAIETVKALYTQMNGPDAAKLISAEIFNGGHQISTAALMPWLAKLD